MSLKQTAEALIRLVGDGWDASSVEHEHVDFKQTPSLKDRRDRERFMRDLAESAVCFANGPRDGVLIIGVANRGTLRSDALPGVDTSAWNIDTIVEGIHSRTSPSIAPKSAVLEIEGRVFFALGVSTGASVYSTTEGVYKYRLNDKCLPLSGESLRALQAERGEYDWSALPADADWNELSRTALERAAELLVIGNQSELADMAVSDTKAFAKATQIATRDGRPTNAAVLIYGTPKALARIPTWGVNVQTRPSPGGEARVLLRGQDTNRPLVLLLDDLLRQITTLATSHQIRIGAQQVELVDYPPDALREILANAFVHRDWEVSGLVEVVHSPENLTVTSPGSLLPHLRLDRLLHDAAAPRNRMLAGHVVRLRLAEMSGLGLDRAFRSLSQLGKEPPTLEDGPRFRVTLPGGAGDEAFARFIMGPTMPPTVAGDVDCLMVLTALRAQKSVSAPTLSPRLQRSPEDVQRVLERLSESGLIEATRGTARRANPTYVLTSGSIAGMKSAIQYRTTDLDSDDEKLLRHLRRHHRLTNEDVRNYLDCDVSTARNRLTRLRKKRLIAFAPDSPKRGAHVVYVLLDEPQRADVEGALSGGVPATPPQDDHVTEPQQLQLDVEPD